ncbi:hypothetical protein E2C01_055594 [Portunus trituberculatus]|uniref:Uncharacterized protein n=1 Tax=Portunus trituberculatus TaxID=210409 RepID=A0A5B7GN52_PORTR|nr:hypothetical protein [Portunus trituberculatus]
MGYPTFILPKLMYVSPAWSSSLSCTQQQQLGSVQKRACKVILDLAYTNYEDTLTTLSLPKLSNTLRSPEETWERRAASPMPMPLVSPPDAPHPVRATRHHQKIMPLRAPRMDPYHLSAIPIMVRAINH